MGSCFGPKSHRACAQDFCTWGFFLSALEFLSQWELAFPSESEFPIEIKYFLTSTSFIIEETVI